MGRHEVNVHGSQSRNKSMIIHIENPFEGERMEEVAEGERTFMFLQARSSVSRKRSSRMRNWWRRLPKGWSESKGLVIERRRLRGSDPAMGREQGMTALIPKIVCGFCVPTLLLFTISDRSCR